MKRWFVVLSLVAVEAACGGARTASPIAPSLAPPSGVFVLTGTVSGLDGAGASPLADATVSATGDGYALAQSDGEGRFRLEGLSAGAWTVTVSHDGFAVRQTRITLTGDMSIDLALNPTDAPGGGHEPRPLGSGRSR